MSRLRSDTDLFSPIQFDTSLADISSSIDESVSNIANERTNFTFMDLQKHENIFPEMKSNEQKNELASQRQHSYQNKLKKPEPSECSSLVSSRSSTSSSNSKKYSVRSKMQAAHKRKDDEEQCTVTAENTIKTSENQQKIKNSQANEKFIFERSVHCGLSANKSPRPVSLISKAEPSQHNRNIKESINASSSSKKVSSKKDNLKDKNSLELKQKNIITKPESSEARKCTKDKNALKSNLLKNDSNCLNPNPEILKLVSNHSQYEISVEKIVHDHISFECDRIRQNVYMQQMSFYRQINKIKDEMEYQHAVTTQGLCKLAEELMELATFLNEK